MGELNRREIGEKLKKMNDYARMGYLSDCLKKSLDFDTKRFVLLKLAVIYEGKKMYAQAGKLLENGGSINPSNRGKVQDYSEAGRLFIKGGDFESADKVLVKAISYGDLDDKREINERKIELLKEYADNCYNLDKRNKSLLAFEKLWSMNLLDDERLYVRNKLLDLYERLGKIREFTRLKKIKK